MTQQTTALRPLEEMIKRWKKAGNNPDVYIVNRSQYAEMAGELASTLPEMERLIGKRVAAMRGAAAKVARKFAASEMQAESVEYRISVIPDEQADKWLAEHDRELTKRVLEKIIDQIEDYSADFDRRKLVESVRALGGSE